MQNAQYGLTPVQFVGYTLSMKSGPFIKAVSLAYEVEEKSVIVFARTLKEAGYMTSTIRGINAPHMKPVDLAALTIAMLATERPAWCAGAFEAVSKMQLSAPVEGTVNPDHTFLEAVTYLCGPIAPLFDFEIEVTGKQMAIIKKDDQINAYLDREELLKGVTLQRDFETSGGAVQHSAFADYLENSSMRESGIITTRAISSHTLQNLKAVVFGHSGAND
jgi:hypothetical protein